MNTDLLLQGRKENGFQKVQQHEQSKFYKHTKGWSTTF